MNHVVAAAAGLVLDQPSFFSTLLKKLILPPSVSIFKFLLSHDSPLHSPRCSCGHHPRLVTIIHLSPGSTQPAVHTIHTRLGGPS